MKNKRLAAVIILFSFALFIFAIVLHNYSQPKITQQRHIIFGVWTEGFFDGSSKTLHPEKLLQFEQMIHEKISLAHYYIGWEVLANPNLITQFETLRSYGWMPLLNVNPYYFPQCPVTKLPLYKAIAEGKCDNFLHKAGKNLSHVKQPFYLVFGWEMNNKDNEWSIPYTKSSPTDFIAAWRHIHSVFKQEKASNVIWVFCPNVPDDAKVPYSTIYPGNDYVDWIGLDGYNWGTTQSWSQWISFAGVFTGSYKKLTGIAPNKPMMLAEVNTTDKGGDKSVWYTDMLTKQIPYNFPKIDAVVIFNEDKKKQEHVNWRVDVTPDTLHAFIAGIHSGFY